jgi:glycosyltransferase involved in cell wall biosynthesis
LLTRTLVANVLNARPDVVHFFKPKAYAGLAHLVLWWLRRLGGISMRLVLDTDDWEQAWNKILPYSAVQKKLFAWQENWGLQHADTVTAASRALEDLTSQTRGTNAGVFYLPNGYLAEWPEGALSAEKVREMWQLGRAPVILLYSRFIEFRLERIVTLVKEVAGSVPEARWLIVGCGLQGEEQQLADKLAKAGLAEYARFTGWLPFDHLPACFAAADVAIHPYDDTIINRTKCSIKLIDLLMAGVPVVADDVGQNGEYIESGVSGSLVSSEDDTAFAGAILDLLHNPEKRAGLGKAAAVRIRENFGWTHLSQVAERSYRW